MNNFRHHHPKPFGGRGPEIPNPWMTEDELASMRRQNPQFHSPMQNMPPSMHSPLLNQSSLLSAPNKSFLNQNSCKMQSSNFTRSPNMDLFKSSHMNESNYPSRFMGNRFPNNSYSHMNMQHKMNEGPPYKDFAPSNVMSPQSNKNDGFSDSISKPLYSNIRQPQERFSCMQNDQAQFHSKYDNSRVYQEKGFQFPSDKDFQSQNPAPLDHLSVGSNFSSYKPSYRPSSLFPAYTPKEMQDESSKSVQPPSYNSNFLGKSNTFCDKTSLPSTFVGKSDSFCEKSPVCSTTFSKTEESFQGKTDLFQGKAEPYQERNFSERVANDLFPPNSTTPSYMYDKLPLKTMPTQVSHDSFKTLSDPVTSSSKYSYPLENQQACYPSSNEIPIQQSQNMQIPNYPSSTSAKDCLMQTVPFSSQSDVQQNVKENFSSFNFESNITTTDIAELLPGLDAFLKEHLEKPDEGAPKTEISKSSGSNCAFSDDEWSKHSIPFIGDNQTSEKNLLNNNKDESPYDQSAYMKEKCSDKFELKSEKGAELHLPDIKQPNNYSTVGENLPKTTTLGKEPPKVRSALEEAIETLVKNDAIVGLDYIIEYKRNIAHEGSFAFRCKLCNSAITRPSIMYHILGSKHRMRYLKTKDESKYEYIISLKIEKSEKDDKIAEAALEMEKIYGRGCVTVDTVEYQKDSSADNSSKEVEDGTVEPVFTLDKIPIGFEALSPQHEEMNAEFSLESNLNQAGQDTDSVKKETTNVLKSAEEKRDAACNISSNSVFTLPGLDSDSSFLNMKSGFKSVSPHANCNSEVQKNCNVDKESDIKVQLQYLDSALCGSAKRSSSPEVTSRAKIQKTDSRDETKPCSDILLDPKKTDVQAEDSASEKKEFSIDILENLAKSSISSDEEASVVLKVINVLMELLLRYKLQHLSLGKMEKLMKSLQTKSPENIEDLSSLLKDSNTVERKDVEASTSLIKDTTDNVHLKLNIPLEDNSGRQVKQELSSHVGNTNPDVKDLNLPVKNISNNSTSDLALSTKALLPTPDTGVNNASTSVPHTSGSVTLDNTTEASKNITDTSCASQSAASQASSSLGLKPPPFFGWQQTNEAVINQVSYAQVQGSQNMIWTSPYQHTQTQYSQMPYYQPQNYGNTFSGTQAYQNQFSVLSQNSVPVEIAQPPLPPPPPPPPPAPSNPPLPPLPNSPLYRSKGSSHSVPLPSNAPACVPMYSKQPPLPPPPPLP